MCVNFWARAICILDEDAKSVGHDGKPYVNTDYPKDTVLCMDNDGNVYISTMYSHEDAESRRDPKCWPPRCQQGIPLFRDYWRFSLNSNEKQTSPYHSAIVNAPKTWVVPPLNQEEQEKLAPHDPNSFWK